MAIKIEPGVPRPSGYSELSSALKAMTCGDSFLVGDFKEASIRTTASKHGIKVSIKTDKDGNRRCWRTA